MSLKVIGAGYGRTGTQSLKRALEILMLGKCYHMEEMLRNPQGVNYWVDAYNNKNVDWDSLFKDYHSIVGFPGAIYYKELADHYPEAKIILTYRNPEQWYESFSSTVASYKMALSLNLKMHLKQTFSKNARDLKKAREINRKAIWGKFFDNKFYDKEQTIQKYCRHIETVKSQIPQERLLVFKFPHSWEKLCMFLNKDIPDTPYPVLNKKTDFNYFVNSIYSDVLNT